MQDLKEKERVWILGCFLDDQFLCQIQGSNQRNPISKHLAQLDDSHSKKQS